MSLRQAAQQALDDICGAKLCEFNSMSSRHEMVRLMDSAITVLRQALAEHDRLAGIEMLEKQAGIHVSQQAEPEQEPVAWACQFYRGTRMEVFSKRESAAKYVEGSLRNGADMRLIPIYTTPHKPLTPREIELLDGMIEVQLHHAAQCDRIANRTMAEKQKGWDMERVALLRKLKAAHGIGEQHE